MSLSPLEYLQHILPALFGLFSLVTLLAQALCPNGQLPLPQSVWYNPPEKFFPPAVAPHPYAGRHGDAALRRKLF
jgi:hypothetical protein